MTNPSPRVLPMVALLALAACQTAPLTTVKQPLAVESALTRGKFELACPEATATVLSSQIIEPIVRFGGYERAEFTIGVAGCGKRQTYIVVCADQTDGCVTGVGNR
jgi:hypothetical protein